MSDEHEHNHPFPFFQFLVGPTPEQVEREKLQAVSNAHEMHHFMDSLDEQQLIKLIDLIKVVSSSDAAAFYYIGVLAHKLDLQFGRCMSCGNKHDEELAAIVGDGGPVEALAESVEEPLVKGSKKYDELMYLYGMEQDDDGSDRVMCKDCGKWYENLADRMLRKAGPAGCSGCINKTKWG